MVKVPDAEAAEFVEHVKQLPEGDKTKTYFEFDTVSGEEVSVDFVPSVMMWIDEMDDQFPVEDFAGFPNVSAAYDDWCKAVSANYADKAYQRAEAGHCE